MTTLQVKLGDRWMPFRQLDSLIKVALSEAKDNNALSQLKNVLDSNKAEFVSFLNNPPKNPVQREEVEKASKDGIFVLENDNRFKTVMPESLVAEALLFSDIFNLNELTSLELLITAENQMSRYPDMSRGTIAVLYYYHGRKAVASALNSLIQARSGRTWTPSKLSRETLILINNYTDSLKQDDIVLRCLTILEEFNIAQEFEMLESNRALGPYVYRKRILEIMKETKRTVANIVFNYSSQTFLNENEIFELLETLAKCANFEENYLDSVTTCLLFSLFYTFDVSILCQELDDENDRTKYASSQQQQLKQQKATAFTAAASALKPEFIKKFLERLNVIEFKVESIRTMIKFFVGLNLKTINLYSIEESMSFNSLNEDELIDKSIESGVFEIFTTLLAENKNVYAEEFFVRQLHNMIGDFIVNMSGKLKDLRDRTDESCRVLNAFTAESIKPFPTSPSLDFNKFLIFITNFYQRETQLSLSSQYWINFEANRSSNVLISSRQHSLHKFVRSLHESTFPQIIVPSVIDFFASLAQVSPFNMYNMIKNVGFHASVQFSIQSFSDCINQYLFGVRGADNNERVSASVFSLVPNSGSGGAIGTAGVRQQNKVVIEASLVGSIVRLFNQIVKNDRSCCVAIAECQQYPFIANMVAILRCAVPRELKSDILHCFASFAKQISVSTLIWKEIDSILPRYNQTQLGHQKLYQNGIAIEIEEIEVKNEEYPITLGFLELMSVLFSHYETAVTAYQQNLSENCFNFIMDSILLKSAYRVFKNQEEKWKIISLCYNILLNTMKRFDGSFDNFTQRIFNVFSQVLQENHLSKHIIWTLEEVIAYYEIYIISPTLRDRDPIFEQVEHCALIILGLLTNISEKEQSFFEMIKTIQGLSISTFVKLDVIFNNINHKTNRQDRLAILFRIIPIANSLATQTLKLLISMCENNFDVSYSCLNQLHNTECQFLKSELIINMFVECIECSSDSRELRLEALKFIDVFLGDAVTTNLRYTFAHKLIGIESKLFNLANVNFFGQFYTCLQSMLSFFDSSSNFIDLIEERRYSMKILHKLCSSVHTYEVVLRFLRTSYEFNSEYLKFLFESRSKTTDDEQFEELLVELTYFLKILSIDIKVTSEQNLKSYIAAFAKVFFEDTMKPRLLSILFEYVFLHQNPELPKLSYFDSDVLFKTIATCLNESKQIILPLLHQKLIDDINSYGPQIIGSSSSNAAVREQIQQILFYCTSMNRSQEYAYNKAQYVAAWCELTQTMILCKVFNDFGEEFHCKYLMEICSELIIKLCDENYRIDSIMFNSISSTLLVATQQLTQIKCVDQLNVCNITRVIISILEKNHDVWTQKQKRSRVNLYCTLLSLFKILPTQNLKDIRFNRILLDRITNDILAGHEVTKMLSICVLNQTESTNWLSELVSNGSMKHLLLSILTDEKQIRMNKYEHVKTFYVFQAKMTLLLKICNSNANKNSVLSPLEIATMIEDFQNFDIYPYLVCENNVCFKMFSNILRLMVAITTNFGSQVNSNIGLFISTRPMLSDLIRIAPSIKDTESGKELLLLITRLIGTVILDVNDNLKSCFVSLLSQFSDETSLKTSSGSEMVFQILQGCIKIVTSQTLQTQIESSVTTSPANSTTTATAPGKNVFMFRPSLQNADARVYSKHPLGLLVSIINTCQFRKDEILKSTQIVESALYLIYAHLQEFYRNSNSTLERGFEDIVSLKKDAESIFNDMFFAKIDSTFEKNIFIETLGRKIRKLF